MSQIWIERLLHAHTLDSDDLDALRSVETHVRRYSAGQTILFEDDRFDMLYAVISGWIGNTRDLEDGTEQILDIFLPGQLVGLRQLATPEALIDYRALTDAEVCLIEKKALQETMAASDNINAAVLQSLAMEDAWLMERVNTLGKRSAAACIMHFLLEISDRLALVSGQDEGTASVELPISQEQLGTILAITPVHVSRVLKDLRTQGLLEDSDQGWRLPDREAAERFCDYQARRLQLDD
ncbi:hypothetical protein AY599_08985 [Leptolyngbya valderiana BDU 20041]|nr:hypothetical protein AY599_08985 [Leptolyngbya valderiana BDU 20041]